MPPSVRYYNQTAPFVAGLEDLVASLQEQGSNLPFFASNANRDGEDAGAEAQESNPWANGWGGFPFGGMPHRGRRGSHPRGPPPPGPPPHHEHGGPPPPPGPPPPGFGHHPSSPPPPSPPEWAQDPPEVDPSEPHGPPHHGGPSRHGRCGGRGRGGWGARSRHGPPHGGPRGFRGPMGGLGALAEMFQSQFFDEETSKKDDKDESFKPDVDIFDTPEAFVVHVSLPGAKKNDIGVNWNAETSELSIAGVVCRPGDEDLLKTLALDERKVGAFERKVRLGSRANPAQIDADGISAKMEDGVLRIDVPKLDGEYVEIKKVDIE